MTRPTDAIVTGFTKNAALCEASLAPLRALKRDGVLRRIVCVTWTAPEIDAFVAPIAAMDDVELVRVAQPAATGSPYQRGTVYQVRNLAVALDQIVEDDVLVLKSRPDFVADADLLKAKITNFDTLCAPKPIAVRDTPMPASPFKAKIWLPWADANQPFFYEDAAFLGLKCDVAKLVTPKVEDRIGVLDTKENIYGPYAHVVRFGSIFRDSLPIFARYLKDYRFFVNSMDYRKALLPRMTQEPFFFHLIAAHAWVLATNFHVDCGRQGQISHYPNCHNLDADWSSFASLRVNPPFDQVETWRETTKPGALSPAISRLYGRLVDDRWQHALFDGRLSDVTSDAIHALVRGAALYRTGVLAASEEKFYRTLADVYRAQRLSQAAA